MEPPYIHVHVGFSKNMKLSSNQNETFSTCSLIMSASYNVNWMTS